MLGQKECHILEKPSLRSSNRIGSPIFLKLGQDVTLDNIWVKLEYVSGRVKTNRPLGQILEKPCLCSTGHIFVPMFLKIGLINHVSFVSYSFSVCTCTCMKHIHTCCVHMHGSYMLIATWWLGCMSIWCFLLYF